MTTHHPSSFYGNSGSASAEESEKIINGGMKERIVDNTVISVKQESSPVIGKLGVVSVEDGTYIYTQPITAFNQNISRIYTSKKYLRRK
jgi:hypothetical protein